MKRLYQSAMVIASTGLGIALGRCMLLLVGLALAQHFPTAPTSAKPAVNDFGSIIGTLFNMGYYAGLLVGVVMTLAVLSGVIAGVALARRVGKSTRLPGLRTV